MLRLPTALLFLAAVPSLVAAQREHPSKDRDLAVGVAAHLVAAVGESCTTDVDVVDCQDLTPFAGADVTVHWWPTDWFALGGRVAGAKDLDASETTDASGLSIDPEDQWLWRVAAEARLDPPILPSGIWLGGEVGLALLSETQRRVTAAEVDEAAKTRAVPLLGIGVGWDLWLGRSLYLTPEVRGALLFFGDAPELRPGLDARDYGTSTWLEAALRLSLSF